MDSSSPAPASDNESPAQRQARLRRERRQAKIATGGEDRLRAITNASGRKHMPVGDKEPKPSQQPSSSAAESQHTPDPDHDDISQHVYEPRRLTPRPTQSGSSSPFPMGGEGGGPQGGPDEMMQQLLQQFLGGGAPGGGLGGGANGPQLPPGLADMFGGAFPGGGFPGGPGQDAQQQQPPSDSTYVWRIVHAIFSLFLALYVTLSSPISFTGSKAAREVTMVSGVGEDFGQRLFFWFATVEVVLQSSRYFMERGQLPKSGMLGTLAAFLPPPFGGYVRLVGRYSVIFGTVTQDALIVVFVLGAVAWWNGMIQT